MLAFNRSPDDCDHQIEIWLNESFGCGHRKQERRKLTLIAWVGFLPQPSRKSSLSNTALEAQFRYWLWDSESSLSGFSETA